jgi:excinuclease ABC subunit C
LDEIRAQVLQFPDKPGVYQMKDEKGAIIYVGKAKNLKKRVLSYFSSGRDVKTRLLVSRIHSIDPIVTANEYEALVLENNLIKKWNPRYNINLKDGKTYPVIRVTKEDFPRVFRTRRIVQDGSSYYGPFPDAKAVDRYLELIERLFPLRKCKGDLKGKKLCLYYHLGRCGGPCEGLIDTEAYGEQVHRVKQLLGGETDDLLEALRRDMEAASEALEFERAAAIRDNMDAIRMVGAGTQVQDFDPEGRDYIACAIKEELCTFSVFQIRNGKLIGQEQYRSESAAPEEEALPQFLLQYYTKDRVPPPKVYFSHPVDTASVVEYLAAQGWSLDEFDCPQEGRHASITRMALENGLMDVDKRIRDRGDVEGMQALQEALGLSALPRRIEGFDIAQLHGTNPVASLVSFKNGRPDKASYRRYHVKTLEGKIDDFESMREVTARRYTRVLNENLERPDLIMIDGGKGQISAVKEILDLLSLDIPIVGLAKREEEVFVPGQSNPIVLPLDNPGLRVLVAVRDEAHRFATTFQRALRKKDATFSLLEEAPGIGPVRSAKLLEEFGSLDGIVAAAPEAIAEVIRTSPEVAQEIQEFLAGKGRT